MAGSASIGYFRLSLNFFDDNRHHNCRKIQTRAMMEDLGRCENCGKLVPEIELTSLEIDDPFDIVEELWCQNCYDEEV